MVRSRAHRKRSVGSLRWALGPGLDLAVKLYQLLQPQKPPGVRLMSVVAPAGRSPASEAACS